MLKCGSAVRRLLGPKTTCESVVIWIEKTKQINFQQNTDIQFFYGVRNTSQSREPKSDTDEGLEFTAYSSAQVLIAVVKWPTERKRDLMTARCSLMQTKRSGCPSGNVGCVGQVLQAYSDCFSDCCSRLWQWLGRAQVRFYKWLCEYFPT